MSDTSVDKKSWWWPLSRDDLSRMTATQAKAAIEEARKTSNVELRGARDDD